ncbi:5-hydroxytryptamine receptor 3A-like [Megalobrama amblycephala]|uniref:5-hydroxytryptamine receptor 3A-like n=1 Tax=Megalobrama amblycephala TaxID=75352 RepID=UPI00201407BB|nr:5-hydroxytryptamine receptor 3A-like [Megalobrama amblycephala]
MDLRWLIFYLASVGWVSAAGNCSYKELIEHLGLDNSDVQMTSLRPVRNWTTPTTVFMNLLVTSITEVNEKAQSISTQITVTYGWHNEFTVWNRNDFCGIFLCSVKKDMIWTPDISIIESIKTEFATTECQYVQLQDQGIIVTSNTLALTTACKMNLDQFPFDIQSCNFTLQSPIHSSRELMIRPFSDASFLTLNSKKAFQTQGEWELLSINISTGNASTLGEEQDQLIYTITMKRKPFLYVINFLMPVFYFLVLDLASFFIDSNGGEKLSFKVTLLLAISVLLLLLKDMLPSTANDIPLIGIYCVVIFTLMAISVLETIFVNFLMAKGNQTDSAAPVVCTSALSDTIKDTNGPSDSMADHSEERPYTLNALKQILMEFQAAAHQNQQERKPLCWTRVATIIDVIFFVLYITTVIVFLALLFKDWFMSKYNFIAL